MPPILWIWMGWKKKRGKGRTNKHFTVCLIGSDQWQSLQIYIIHFHLPTASIHISPSPITLPHATPVYPITSTLYSMTITDLPLRSISQEWKPNMRLNQSGTPSIAVLHVGPGNFIETCFHLLAPIHENPTKLRISKKLMWNICLNKSWWKAVAIWVNISVLGTL